MNFKINSMQILKKIRKNKLVLINKFRQKVKINKKQKSK